MRHETVILLRKFARQTHNNFEGRKFKNYFRHIKRAYQLKLFGIPKIVRGLRAQRKMEQVSC